MPSMKIYRIVTLTPSVATNIVTGTTAAPTTPYTPTDKGVELTIQNQSTAATSIYIGDSNLAFSVGATSTTGNSGIQLVQNASYTFGKRHAPSAIQAPDYYILSTSSNAVAVCHLLKAV